MAGGVPFDGESGPATLSLAALGSAYGIAKCLPYYFGIVLGTSGVLVLIATGLTGLLFAQPAIARIVTVLASVYILYLAYKIATAPVGPVNHNEGVAPSLLSGFLLAIANPKAFAAIGAVYSGNTLTDTSVVSDAVLKIAALVFVIVVVNFVWLVAGNAFSNVLGNVRIARIINVVFAILLVLSVGFALSS